MLGSVIKIYDFSPKPHGPDDGAVSRGGWTCFVELEAWRVGTEAAMRCSETPEGDRTAPWLG